MKSKGWFAREPPREIRVDGNCRTKTPFAPGPGEIELLVQRAGPCNMPPARNRIGVGIGGTFTDLIALDTISGDQTVGKVLTTPADPSEAVQAVQLQALEELGIEVHDLAQVIHGTTHVTNAVIERKGAVTALLTTQGFRDSIEIGRENRYDLYDLMLERPDPWVPRHLRFDVPQRRLADNRSELPLDSAYVERLARELAATGVEAIAVVFLHSYADAQDEEAARAIIKRAAPDIRVSISSELVPEIRDTNAP